MLKERKKEKEKTKSVKKRGEKKGQNKRERERKKEKPTELGRFICMCHVGSVAEADLKILAILMRVQYENH